MIINMFNSIDKAGIIPKTFIMHLVIGRMAHLQILKSINQVVVHSDSVKILLEDAMIINRTDLSLYTIVSSAHRRMFDWIVALMS